MSAGQEGKRPELTARDRVSNWYLDAAQTLASARAGLGRLNDSSVMDYQLPSEIRAHLWEARSILEVMQVSLLSREDLARTRTFDSCYAEAQEGTEAVDASDPDMGDRELAFREDRQEINARYSALLLMLADMKAYLTSKGLFGFEER